MSRFPFRTPRSENQDIPVGPRSSPQGLRKNTGRTSFTAARLAVPLDFPNAQRALESSRSQARRPTRNVCRSLRAVPPPGSQGPPRSGVSGSTTRTPASLKGLLTRRISSYLVFFLADECNRPDCQRATAESGRLRRDRIISHINESHFLKDAVS